MNAMNHREYIGSEEWKQLRKQALERDGNRCRVCNSDAELNVHHRKYPEERNNWSTDCLDNLTTLCKKCHYSFHKKTNCSEDENKDDVNGKIAVVNLVWSLLDEKLDNLEISAQVVFDCLTRQPLHEGPFSQEEIKQGFTMKSVLSNISGLSYQLKLIVDEIIKLQSVRDDLRDRSRIKNHSIEDLVLFTASEFVSIDHYIHNEEMI